MNPERKSSLVFHVLPSFSSGLVSAVIDSVVAECQKQFGADNVRGGQLYSETRSGKDWENFRKGYLVLMGGSRSIKDVEAYLRECKFRGRDAVGRVSLSKV